MCTSIFYKKGHTECSCYLNPIIRSKCLHIKPYADKITFVKQKKVNYYQRFTADCNYGFACTSQSCLKRRIFIVFPYSVKRIFLKRTEEQFKTFFVFICFIQHFYIFLSPYTPIKRYWSVHFIDYGSVLKILS